MSGGQDGFGDEIYPDYSHGNEDGFRNTSNMQYFIPCSNLNCNEKHYIKPGKSWNKGETRICGKCGAHTIYDAFKVLAKYPGIANVQPVVNPLSAKNEPTPLDVQVGGDHYKRMKIQPVEYCHANDLDYFQGNVVKYVSRWKYKNGMEDLKKAKHYLEIYIQLEEAKEKENV